MFWGWVLPPHSPCVVDNASKLPQEKIWGFGFGGGRKRVRKQAWSSWCEISGPREDFHQHNT